MRVLDLFSGLGGFSQGFRDRGHEVITVDIVREFNPSIQGDVRYLPIRESAHFDVILASPPCDDFSKAEKPWYDEDDYDIDRGMELVYVTKEIIDRLRPRFWVVENVRGAVKYFRHVFGPIRQRCGSRYLWGNFPRFHCRHEECYGKWELWSHPMRKALRSKIPYEISINLCKAIEWAMTTSLTEVEI